MLFTVWLADPFRATQDLDLLGSGDAATTSIAATFREICRHDAPDDGLSFDVDGLIAEPIREDQQYGGVRVRTKAFLGKTRIPIQVDIGFGDVITPAIEEITFPSLLDGAAPLLKAYPRETVIAEKFQAIVALGTANSRMKDFYDLLALARLFSFHGRDVAAAIRATFDRRATPIPKTAPSGLRLGFASDSQKLALWSAFSGREPLLVQADSLPAAIEEIVNFIMPPALAAGSNREFTLQWLPGDGWNQAT